MRHISTLIFACATLMLSGCLAIGNGGGEATIADEIRELEELRDDGVINQGQYQAGVNTVLHSVR